MGEGPDHDAVYETGQDPCCIFDWFSSADLGSGFTHINGMSAQLVEPRFK